MYKQQLIDIADELGIDHAWINPVLNNEEFNLWPSSAKPVHHHYGCYGLIKHTWEVVSLCMQVSDFYPRVVCKRLAYLAGLYHDFGKIYDYDYNMEINDKGEAYRVWHATDHKMKIHHIPSSFAYWERQYNLLCNAPLNNKITKSDSQEIGHAILAHHGHKEWGSPVEPRTKLAFLLHYCDAISARMDDTDRLYKV